MPCPARTRPGRPHQSRLLHRDHDRQRRHNAGAGATTERSPREYYEVTFLGSEPARKRDAYSTSAPITIIKLLPRASAKTTCAVDRFGESPQHRSRLRPGITASGHHHRRHVRRLRGPCRLARPDGRRRLVDRLRRALSRRPDAPLRKNAWCTTWMSTPSAFTTSSASWRYALAGSERTARPGNSRRRVDDTGSQSEPSVMPSFVVKPGQQPSSADDEIEYVQDQLNRSRFSIIISPCRRRTATGGRKTRRTKSACR